MIKLTSLLMGILLLAGCSLNKDIDPKAELCYNGDKELHDRAFVFVNSPVSGDRVKSGFVVQGCSRTFESTLNWVLLDQYGDILAEGYAMGGGVDGFKHFMFEVAFNIDHGQIGHLVVYEEDMGEGPLPSQNYIPLILQK